MKPLLRQLLLLLPLLAALGARAQTTLQQEGFAGTPGTSASQVDAANTTSYTIAATGNNNQYFVRAVNGMPPSDVTNPASPVSFGTSTVQNAGVPAGGTFPTTDAYFWIGEAVRGAANAPVRDPGVVQLLPITVTGYANLQVKIGLIDLRNTGLNWENNDLIEIQTQLDGGTWETVGRFAGDNAQATVGGRLRQDANLNGVSYDAADANSPIVTLPMSDFTFNVSGSGTTLRVRVMVTEDGLSEEFAFDNIRVIGTANSSAPPVLANLESTTINYAEGAGAVQITSTLTVSDPDNTTLSGGSVRIVGFDASEDQLQFINQNGITGSFNTATGILTLSGTATLAAYQAALRSVQYQDIDAIDATDGTRTIRFSVTDASGATSSTVSRNILVTSSLDAASTPNYLDDLTDDGEGTRYKSNHFVATNAAAFFRTNIATNEANGPFHSTGVAATTFTNISNSYYWYSAGTGTAGNPSTPKVGTFVTKQINAANYTNLHFKILLGATANSWEVGDYSKLYYRLNGGAWTIFASFRSTDQVTTTNSTTGNLARDADPNNLSSPPTGTVLGPALQQFDFTLPTAVNGQKVDFMIESSTNDSNNNGEVFVFDKIEVTGSPQTTVNSIVRTTPAAATTNATSVVYTITFGAPVTGLTAANFTLTTSGISGATVGTPVSTGTGSTWTVPVNTGTGSGSLTLNLANDTNLSVGISTTLPFAGETYTIDKMAPTATIARQNPTGTATNATAVTFRVTFSEAVTGVSTSSFTLNTTGTAAGTLASVASVSTSVYDVTVSSVSGNGTLGITLKSTGSGVTDVAGNAATGVAGPTYTIDNTAPTVTFTSTPPSSTNSTSATFAFTGSDGTGSGVASFQVSINGGSYIAVTSPLTINGFSNGTNTVQVRAIDNAGNVGTPASYTFTVDTVPPTVTLSSSTVANGGSTTTSPVSFTATFSESVTGFSAAGITVTNGSVTSGPTGSGTTYSFSVTPTTAGTATTVAIVANAAQDAASNGNTASTTYSLTYTLPVMAATVTTDAPASITGTSAVLGGNVTANGGANVSERGVVYVIGTGPPTTSDTKSPNGSGIGSFSQTIGGLRGNTTYTVRAYAINSAGTAYGASRAFTTLNNPPTANADAVTVAEDSAPTVITVLANDNTLPDVGETLVITSTTQPANGTVTINGGTTVSFAPALNFNGTTTFTYTISDGNGGTATATVTVTVTPVNDAPVVTTTAGNTTFIPGGGAVAVDNGLTVMDVDNTTLASATVSFATGFVSGQDLLQPTVLPGGISGVYNNGTGVLTLSGTTSVANYQALLRGVTYNNSSATPNTATRTLNFTANDGSLTSAVATKNVSFAATTTIVSITQNGPSPTNASTVAYTVTFANAVTGVSVSNFTVNATNLTGAGVASVSGSGASYTVTLNTGTLNPGATGSLQLQFSNSTGISPTVTNPGLNGPAYVIDRTAPTATISSSAGASGSTTATSPIPFTVTFSESVTGFSASGITVSNGAVTTGSFSGSGTTYTFTVTPTAAGIATTVAIAANAAQDAAGNGNTISPTYSLTYVLPITATIWTGTISPDWFTAGNWTSGVPTATTDATIPNGTIFSPRIGAGTATTRSLALNSGATLTMSSGTLDVRGNLTNNGSFGPTGGTVVLGTTTAANIFGSSAIRFWNLTVNASGAQLSTSIGASVRQVLTLTGNFATQNNIFTIESNSLGDALVVNSGGVVTGTATVQRAIDPTLNSGLGYRHYGAPVSNSTVADLATTATGGSFAPVVNPTYNSSATPTAEKPFPTVFGYDDNRLSLNNNLSSFDKGFFSPAALSDPLAVGRGYTVNIGASEVVDFQGTLNNDVRTLALTSTRNTYPEGGWQLLGNPYPAPLDYSRVAAADRIGLESAIYVYSSTSQYGGRYRTYINGIGNPVLPLGQGFFARVATGQTSATMTFRNSQRLTAPSGTTFQRPLADPRPLVQLTLQGAGTALADEAYVYFEQGASSGFEPAFDAEKLPNPTGLNLSASSSGKQLAIDGRAALGTAQCVVPLAVGVPTPGSYTLTAAQLLNLATTPTYLRDLQTGALIDLTQQPTYQFTVSNASALVTGRFELVFSPQQPLATAPAALAQQVALYPNPATTSVWLELPASLGRQAITATLLDAVGREVRTIALPAQGTVAHQLDLHQLATGVYALRLSTSAGVVVKKLVVE